MNPITMTPCCGAPIWPRCKSGAQTALRIVLAIALVCGRLSLPALVWYWMGYYGGPPAHEYFGRWVLAWFFTEDHSAAVRLNPVQGRALHHRQHVPLPQPEVLLRRFVRGLVLALRTLGRGPHPLHRRPAS